MNELIKSIKHFISWQKYDYEWCKDHVKARYFISFFLYFTIRNIKDLLILRLHN